MRSSPGTASRELLYEDNILDGVSLALSKCIALAGPGACGMSAAPGRPGAGPRAAARARQLLLRRRRQQRPQLFVGAAEVHDEARLERVAQLAQDDALFVAAQLRERHRRRACALGGGASRVNHSFTPSWSAVLARGAVIAEWQRRSLYTNINEHTQSAQLRGMRHAPCAPGSERGIGSAAAGSLRAAWSITGLASPRSPRHSTVRGAAPVGSHAL